MRALVLDYQRRVLTTNRVAAPVYSPASAEQVLLRMVEIGICGTDRGLANFLFGAPPAGQTHLILGHEALAEVAAAPPGCPLQPGQLVVPVVRRPCLPGCRNCRRHRRDLCLTGGFTERGILGAHGYAAEWAVDHPQDLIPVPARLADVAILVEPMSVAAKSVELLRRHAAGGRKQCLVLGAGPVGLLVTAVLSNILGWPVTVYSREAEDSLSAQLVAAIGARYTNQWPTERFGAVVEACGDAHVTARAAGQLDQGAALVVLGANQAEVEFPFRHLIFQNATVVGCVNSAHTHFARAVENLQRLPLDWLNRLIHRASFADAPASILHPEKALRTSSSAKATGRTSGRTPAQTRGQSPALAPKRVHRLR